MNLPSASAATECPSSIELDTSGEFSNAVTFSANGEYLVGGGYYGVRVWRVENGKEVAKMKLKDVRCIATSQNGKWIAAGAGGGEVLTWDTETYEQAKLKHRKDSRPIIALDFSPDSTCLIRTSRESSLAAISDAATGRPVLTLNHTGWLVAAVYSPDGSRIVTATDRSVQVWDSSNGQLFLDIPVSPETLFDNRSLLWFNNHLFVISGREIKEFETSTGTVVSHWAVRGSSTIPGIVLPRHMEFIAHSAEGTVTFWDTSTHTQLGLIQLPAYISSLTFSPDDRLLAIGFGEKIIIQRLASASAVEYPPLFMHITDAAPHSWEQDRLVDAEATLTGAIPNDQYERHLALATRALVRSKLQRWNLAIEDAEKSIRLQRSDIGYVAKSVILIENGQKDEGCRMFDLAFRHCHPTRMDSLLLIKAVVLFMAGKHNEAVSRIGDLIATVEFDPVYYVVQAMMHLHLGNSHMANGEYENAIHSFELARAKMRFRVRFRFHVISLISGWKFDDLGITIRQCLCEALCTAGRTIDAGKSLLELMDTIGDDVCMSGSMAEWISNFAQKCLSTPEFNGAASKTVTNDNVSIYRAALYPQTYTPLLRAWAKATLAKRSWKDALAIASSEFVVPRFTTYRAIYECLETPDRMTDASECFHQIVDEMVGTANAHDEEAEWVLGKLESLGDSAMIAERHSDAVSHYSAALALHPAAPPSLFVRRSRAYVAGGLWEAALNDAKKAIELDSSSPWGYERMHAALHRAGDYANAINAFELMLSKISQSSDPEVRGHQYISPRNTKMAIRNAVQDAIRDAPRVLINTISGRLVDKSEQVSAFELLPDFDKLISSMTTNIDRARIQQDVTQYYRYAMFSHTWEANEPLFEKVKDIVVYDLEESPTNDKLRVFCKIVQDTGLHWAWSDTCCINKADHFVLQEALVSMFKWYQGSAQTLVLLRGVRSPSRRGDLVKSIWNSRAWTFQEYHASKVVRFYNEDWTLYMSLDIPNHKESPEILSEMEEATGISAQALMTLQPGSDNIRKKLYLASTRQTTLLEDEAYSLLGLFSISLPVVYGEGDQALGRLLSQLVMSSGDTNILAWTGKSGSFNSCLPARISVFGQLLTPHIPPSIMEIEMETVIGLRNASLNPDSITKLYLRLDQLRVPSFLGKRMILPCITFKLGPLSVSLNRSERIFRAQTDALGIVEIRTEEDLSRFNRLYLVHPWIDFLLDRQPVGNVLEILPDHDQASSSTIGEPPLHRGPFSTTLTAPRPRTAQLAARIGLPFSKRTPTHLREGDAFLRPPSSLSETDKQTCALRVLARLRRPFGALLFTPSPSSVAAYKRVATESLITVQVEEITPSVLNKLIEGVSVLDVL